MQLPGEVHVPVASVHRLKPVPRWRHRPAQPFDAQARALLWQLRWRPPAPQPLRRGAIVALVVLLHLVVLVGMRDQMQPGVAEPRVVRSDYIEVRLLDAPVPVAAPAEAQRLPTLTVNAPATPSAARPRIVPRKVAREVREPASAAARIYDAKGEILLPAGALSAAPAPLPEYRAALPEATPGLLEHKSPITYTPTRFEKYWVPQDETALESVVRKSIVEKTVMKLPGNYRVKCVGIPFMLVATCGIGAPEQLSAPLEVKHERDNLASATPLIPARAASIAAPARSASSPAPAATVPQPAAPASHAERPGPSRSPPSSG